jgi:hypothetical protein
MVQLLTIAVLSFVPGIGCPAFALQHLLNATGPSKRRVFGVRPGAFARVTREVTSMDLPENELGVPTANELPIADYDHLPKVAVERRVPALGREDLETILRYERTHRDRTPLVRLLMARLRQMRYRMSRDTAVGGYGPAPR